MPKSSGLQTPVRVAAGFDKSNEFEVGRANDSFPAGDTTTTAAATTARPNASPTAAVTTAPVAAHATATRAPGLSSRATGAQPVPVAAGGGELSVPEQDKAAGFLATLIDLDASGCGPVLAALAAPQLPGPNLELSARLLRTIGAVMHVVSMMAPVVHRAFVIRKNSNEGASAAEAPKTNWVVVGCMVPLLVSLRDFASIHATDVVVDEERMAPGSTNDGRADRVCTEAVCRTTELPHTPTQTHAPKPSLDKIYPQPVLTHKHTQSTHHVPNPHSIPKINPLAQTQILP